ncbi:carboxypeptidase-like regulatory domain-containing protein [Thalassomonas actiniarum]|uniref:Carboxypeptidase regulatory-like domain-containing protein n=1 Tax=Thalassomonas actiniarum TaxID=485447 RepID=A0AAF0C6C6_9GAMM|nr:carboxypeptidase-like regulatory domain-containing protein [Thalassomonas actiniarum]WDE02473.1 carboxypeptidase regulatory-like domain-containing protein [Thalassomonas actiniarum]
MVYKQEFKQLRAVKTVMLLCFFLALFFHVNTVHSTDSIHLEDLTQINNLNVSLTAGQFNRRTGEITYSATITNNAGESYPGPIYLAISDITDSAVTVVNDLDNSDLGAGFFRFDTPIFEPGDQLSNPVIFSNPTRVRFNFNTSTFFESPLTPDILDISITSPVSGFLTSQDSLVVTGTFGTSVESIEVNGFPATLQENSYSSAPIPLIEGNNTLTAVARNTTGGLGTANVMVLKDSTPPTVGFSNPQNNQVVTTDTIQVSGNVNDIVTGTVNEENCQVTVTGRTGSIVASVVNRSFQIVNFPIVPGLNEITVVARDTAGNESTPAQVNVTRQELIGKQLQTVTGNNQTGEINQILSQPVTVRAVDAAGVPLAETLLQFEVTSNTGLIKPAGSAISNNQLVHNLLTDSEGMVALDWTLGNRVGVGNNSLEVSGIGFSAPLQFFASANPSACSQLLALSGENQVGGVSTALANPLEVVAFDDGGNFCIDQPVTFEIGLGNGNLTGATSLTVNTNADGRAAAILTLGDTPGINNNSVSATFDGLAQNVSFIATAVLTGIEADTRFIGVVLDTENIPVPNATVQIENTDPLIETVTDTNGLFALEGVPIGSGLLLVDGSTTTRSGRWPTLEYVINVISGIDNSLGNPVFLPELDATNFQTVGGNEDVVLTMEGVEGFAMKIFANSATFPDGSTTGAMGVTQVSNDQVPMPPSGGAAPPWVGTLQPAGVFFDPPVQLTVPNSLGLPPNQIVNMFSFDHDLQQFVSVGTGTVQTDGATIVSDPGSGIRKSGWFFDCPPPPPTEETDNCDDPLKNNDLRQAFRDAWTNSNPGGGLAEDNPGRHEQGGWIVQHPDGSITIDPWPLGDGDSITPGPQPAGTIGGFHTHPNTDASIYAQEPSQGDIDTTIPQGVPCYIISNDRIYRVNVDGTVDDLGSRGDLTSPTSCGD